MQWLLGQHQQSCSQQSGRPPRRVGEGTNLHLGHVCGMIFPAPLGQRCLAIEQPVGPLCAGVEHGDAIWERLVQCSRLWQGCSVPEAIHH